MHLCLLDKSAPPFKWTIKGIASSFSVARRIHAIFVKYLGFRSVHREEEEALSELRKVRPRSRRD